MKNSQVKHGQCDSIKFPWNIFFLRLLIIARPVPCWQQDSLLLICPGIYPQIYHRTPCLAEGLIKKKGGVGLFQISLKERLFISYTREPSAFLSSSVWPKREYTWTINWKQSLLIYFENCQDVPCSHEYE